MRIKKIPVDRFLNLILRYGVLVGRFIVIIVLSNILSPRDFGLYSLAVAYAAFIILIMGLDFYGYAHREYVKKDEAKKVLAGHLHFSIIVVILTIPTIFYMVDLEGYDIRMATIFVLLVCSEYFAQETYRYLLLKNKQILSSKLLFLRSVVWILPVFIHNYFFEDINVSFVLLYWAVASILATIISIFELTSIGSIKNALFSRVNFVWIKLGLKVGALFLVGTAAIKLLFTLDKKIIEVKIGLEGLGAYAYYMAFAMAIFSAVDAVILSYAYPRLIRSESNRLNNQGYAKLIYQTLLLSVFMSLIIYAIVSISNIYFQKNLYIIANQDLLILSSAIIAIYSASMIPHYHLFARRQDLKNVFSNVLACIFFISSISYCDVFLKITEINVLLCLGSGVLVLFISKHYFYIKQKILRDLI